MKKNPAENLQSLIKEVATHWGWKVGEDAKFDFRIYIGGDDHGIGYGVKSTSKGWLNVHPWYTTSAYSEAVFSLRDASEVTIFCSLLRDTYLIRAKRRVGK